MSDGPTSPTGFGNITHHVCSGLARLGHHVSLLDWHGRGRPARFRDYTVYSCPDDAARDARLQESLSRLQPDVLITLADTWRVAHLARLPLSASRRAIDVPWALYYPLDSDMGHDRLPDYALAVLRHADLRIAMSQYGCRVTEANGLTPACIPSGVDAALFSPPADRMQAKREVGYEDHFVVLSDARNQIRKLWPRTLEIFRRFAAGKGDVVLHLHCDPHDHAASSPEYHYDLVSDIKFLGLRDKVRFTRGMSIHRGIPLRSLAALYRASDVHLLASWGEGFGLPTLQASAAGVVPLAPAYAANLELVSGHGEALRVHQFVRGRAGLRRALVDIPDAVEKLERLYRDRSLLARKSRAARRFAEAYSWDRIVGQWDEVLRAFVSRWQATARDRDAVREPAPATAIPGLPSEHDQSFTVPVAPFRARVRTARPPTVRRIYLAGPSDVPAFVELRRIFPGVRAWATAPLAARGARGTDRVVRHTVIPRRSPAFRAYLEESILALDLEGVAPAVAALAAEVGLPLVASARNPGQRVLWPDLALETPSVQLAAEKARCLLTDHGAVARACSLARRRLRPPGRGDQRAISPTTRT